MPSYIPTRDGNLNLWVVNFNTLITANPGTYGLVAGDATMINTYVVAFTASLATAISPTTRTKTTVAAKDAAKAAVLDIIRPYAQAIKNNLGVTNADKATLGLTINDLVKTPIPAPSTQPLLAIVGATPLQHSLRFADAAAPDKRAKPAGALGLQLFVSVGLTPPPSALAATFSAFVTKQPFAVNFTTADIGKTAYYYGRWQTRTGLVGPWSSPVSMTVAG